jgi:hypothetical protein
MARHVLKCRKIQTNKKQPNMFLCLIWVLRHTDTVQVIWRRSSFTSEGTSGDPRQERAPEY